MSLFARSLGSSSSRLRASWLALSLSVALPGLAQASPVLLAGDGSEKVHSTHVALLSSGGTNVVTVMPDYQGSLTAFAVVLPVPSDVTSSRVVSLKRDFVDRLETVSAPRFAEFWEMDPCEKGKAEQDWERDLSVGSNPGLLGSVDLGPTKKIAEELLIDVAATTKSGEYSFSVLDSADAVKSLLARKQLALPAGGEEALQEYGGKGYKFVVALVDPNRVELIGGDRAQLSPIRYWTNEDASTVPARFGLPSAAPNQELLVYTLVPDQRMQVTNYPTKAAPTNVTVDFAVKERMGEFYGALYDRFAEKNPGTFLLEYAYSTADCGKPCPTEPLLPSELMSLGGDVIDSKLPKSEVAPTPPPPTPEEEAAFRASLEGKSAKEKADAKKEWEQDRQTIVSRRALLARHKYVLSRLHYRYSKAQLPQDPALGPGGAIQGGVALPIGPEGAADPGVTVASENQFTTRYNNLHPSISQEKCDAPERYRWGKAPRSYRGSKKIWVASDLSRKNRKQIGLETALISPVADLGYAGKAAAAPAATPETAPPEEKKGFCSFAASTPAGSFAALLGVALSVGLARRRRASRG